MTPLGNDSTIAQIPYDTAHARATLDQLGWRVGKDGIRERAGRKLAFELIVPGSSGGRVRGAQILKEQLRLLGVDVRVTVLEFNIHQNRMAAHKFDATFANWNEDPSPSGIRQIWITSAIRESNFGAYSNPVFDRLVDEAVLSRDTAVAHQKWREAYGVINNDAPAIWLYAPLQPTAIHRRYENVTIQRDQWLSTLWTWRIAPGQLIERDRLGALPPASAPSPQRSP
jgi:peptide/nickel transport system substrate-binding protein